MPVAELSTLRSRIQPRSYVAALFANNFKRGHAYRAYAHANGLVVHSTLLKDEWEDLDRQVSAAGKAILIGVNALRQTAGLFRQSSIGRSLAQYGRSSLMPPSNVSMNPLADGERGRQIFGLAGVPLPYTFSDFQLDMDTLAASRVYMEGLDLTQGSEAAYQVSYAWESMLFKGTPAIAVADRVGTLNTIHGYTTYPDRNTGTAVGDWGDTTNGYKNAIATIQNMKKMLRDDRYPAPYWLYVNGANWTDIGTVNTVTDRRVIDVIQADPELQRVEYTPFLNDGEIVLVAPRADVVQWVEKFSIRSVEWDEKGMLGTNYRVIGAGAPLIKSTIDGQCGIAHFTHAT